MTVLERLTRFRHIRDTIETLPSHIRAMGGNIKLNFSSRAKMFGHHVKRALESKGVKARIKQNERKYLEREIALDDKVYSTYKQIKSDKCELCARPGAPYGSSYHYTAKIIRHHIFPRHIYGSINDYNTTRDKFALCCGSCHEVIHRVIREMKRIKHKLTDQDYIAIIDLAKIRITEKTSYKQIVETYLK